MGKVSQLSVLLAVGLSQYQIFMIIVLKKIHNKGIIAISIK